MRRALLALIAACATPPQPAAVVVHPLARAPAAVPSAAAPPARVESPIPIYDDDAAIGSADAPVTVVAYLDTVAPFSQRLWPAIRALRKAYPPEQVRIVLRFWALQSRYPTGQVGDEAAHGVFVLAGFDTLWKFLEQVYADSPDFPRAAVEVPQFLAWARAAGIADTTALERGLADRIWQTALARQDGTLPLSATPTTYVNGTNIGGAMPIDTFREQIDRELAAGKQLVASGTAPADVSAIRTRENLARATTLFPKKDDDTKALELASKRWRVPVAGAPVIGSDHALVTILVNSDAGSRSCNEQLAWTGRILDTYGDDVRFVWRNLTNIYPVGRTDAEANFLAEARAEAGDRGFRAALALVCSGAGLPLDEIARQAGLDVARTRRAVATRSHQREIEADTNLAEDLRADSLTAFIDGRRIQAHIGATEEGDPIVERDDGAVARVIEEELNRSRALLRAGVPRDKLYAEKMKDAAEPERVTSPPPASAPSTGPATAKVVVQELFELPCTDLCRSDRAAFRKALAPYRSRVRVVVRPHSSFGNLQAEVAYEVFAQRGYAAFEQFIAAADKVELKRPELEALAKRVGADVHAALDTRAHAADVQAANDLAGQFETTYIIGGWRVVSPNTPFRFRTLFERALAAAEHEVAK